MTEQAMKPGARLLWLVGKAMVSAEVAMLSVNPTGRRDEADEKEQDGSKPGKWKDGAPTAKLIPHLSSWYWGTAEIEMW